MKVALTYAVLSFGVVYPGQPVLPERLVEYQLAGGQTGDTSFPTVLSAAQLCQRLITNGRFTVAQLTGIMGGASSGSTGGQTLTVSANYVAKPGDNVLVNTAAGNVTVTLPTQLNAQCTVWKDSSDGNVVNLLNLDPLDAANSPIVTPGAGVTTRGTGATAKVWA